MRHMTTSECQARWGNMARDAVLPQGS